MCCIMWSGLSLPVTMTSQLHGDIGLRSEGYILGLFVFYDIYLNAALRIGVEVMLE